MESLPNREQKKIYFKNITKPNAWSIIEKQHNNSTIVSNDVSSFEVKDYLNNTFAMPIKSSN